MRCGSRPDLRRCLGGGGEEHVWAAIIDIQLRSHDCVAACTAPSLQEVSFLFFSGFDSHDVLREWALLPTLAKSTGEAELLASLEALLKATAKAGEVTQRVQGRGAGRLRQRLATNPARGFQLVRTCDRRIGQPAHFSTNDRLRRRRRDWEGSMPTTPGGVRSRRRSDRDLAGGISPCANGPRKGLAYAQGGVFDRTAGSRICDVSFRVLPEFPFVAEVAF